MRRELTGWVTVGYCRKSISNEPQQKRVELLQKMIINLSENDLCEKVFVLPICSASSNVMMRDTSTTIVNAGVLKKLRFCDGDMQGKKKFHRTRFYY